MEPLKESSDTAYLGLGSNLGDRRANLELALQALHAHVQVRVIRCSGIYETEPWGYSDQPRFLNCAVQITTTLGPGQLLELAKFIEKDQGRVASFRYGPRPIDVDILLMNNLDIEWDSPDLQIPHPRMCQRAFVLVPLAEIAGEVMHPREKTTVGKLAAIVDGREGVTFWGKVAEILEAIFHPD